MTAKIFYRVWRLPTSSTALKVGLANVLERVNYFNEVESCDGEAALDSQHFSLAVNTDLDQRASTAVFNLFGEPVRLHEHSTTGNTKHISYRFIISRSNLVLIRATINT